VTLTSAIDRARVRLAADMFRDTIYVLRFAFLDDGAGGQYPDPAGPTAYGPFLGAFSRQSGTEQVIDSQWQQRGTYRLALPIGTDVRDTDQIAYQGLTYNVAFAPPLTGLNLSRVVELNEAGGTWIAVTIGIVDADGLTITDADGQIVTET